MLERERVNGIDSLCGYLALPLEIGHFFRSLARLFGCCQRGLWRAVTKQAFRWRNALTRHEACV